jgi:hypothetical protein
VAGPAAPAGRVSSSDGRRRAGDWARARDDLGRSKNDRTVGRDEVGRCSMTSTARPAATRPIASETTAAVSGSRLAVGSSSTSSGASRSSARASAMPPLLAGRQARARPHRSWCRSRAGARRRTRRRPASRAASATRSARRRVGRGRCCPGSVPRNIVGRCGSQPTCRCHQSGSSVPRSWPSTVTRPRSGPAQPEQHGGHRALAHPARPDQRDHLAATQPQIQLGQHRAWAARAARTVTPVEPDLPPVGAPAGRLGRRRRPARAGRGCARPRPARRRWRDTARPATGSARTARG